MSEAAIAPADTFAADAPNVSETELPDGFSTEAPEQGDIPVDGEESAEEQSEELEDLPDDDPRIQRRYQEWERRKAQALADQKAALESEARQRAEQAAIMERLAHERRMASEAGIAETAKALQELLDGDPVEMGDRLKELAENLRAGATRAGIDGVHELANRFMVGNYGRFVMPNEFIPAYQHAMRAGDLPVATGLMLESIHRLGIETGKRLAAEQLKQSGETRQAAEARAETVASSARERTSQPSPTPRTAARPPSRNIPKTQIEAAEMFTDGRIGRDDYLKYTRGANALPYQ